MAATNDQRRATQATQPREPYNAADERQVAERSSQAKLRELLEAQGLALVMASIEGRAYMFGLLRRCGVYQSSFTGNSETFMREGLRNVGLMILADMMRNHAPQYALMVCEAEERGAQVFRPKKVPMEHDNE